MAYTTPSGSYAFRQLDAESAHVSGGPERNDGAHADATPRAGPEHFDVIVIGGGQAGLSVGYHLARKGMRFIILDGSERIGDSWLDGDTDLGRLNDKHDGRW